MSNKRMSGDNDIDRISTELKKSKYGFFVGDCTKYLDGTNETNYDASNVQRYFLNTGIPKQSLDSEPKIMIDKTNVHLIKSAEYSNPCHRTNHDSVKTYGELTNLCQPFYSQEKKKELDKKDCSKDIVYENDIQKSFLSCPFSSVITLDQALSFYPRPRIVTESKYPFTVLHINGRLTNLTKIQSNEIIGQRLSRLVLSTNLMTLLFNCIEESEVIVDVLSRKTISYKGAGCPKQNSIRCFMSVFPVVPNFVTKTQDTNNTMKVTHFVLELKKCSYSSYIFAQS